MAPDKMSLGYGRVSTDDQAQEGLSSEVQVQKIQEEAEKMNVPLAEPVYFDDGKTGTNVNRVGLQTMLARCKQGDIKYLIVQDTSRLSRNTVDYLSIKQILKDYGVQIVSINQPMTSDDNPYSQFIDEITASANALHPRVTSMKVKITADAKFDFGWWPACAPYGYKNIDNPTPTCQLDRKIVIPDPEKAPLIKEMYEMYATGKYSFLKLGRILNNKGLAPKISKKWTTTSLDQLISNPFYYGLMVRNKEKPELRKELIGKHQPIISKALYDECQYISRKNGNFALRERKHDFLLRGFLFCPVHNRRFNASICSNRDGLSYYHCTNIGGCKTSYIETKKLEKRVANLLKHFEFMPDFIELVKTKLREIYEENKNNSHSYKQRLVNKKRAVEDKRDTLEKYLIEGTIDRDTYKRQHSLLQSEINTLSTQIYQADLDGNIDMEFIEEILSLTRNIYKTYTEAPDFLKKQYLALFFESIEIKNRKVVKYTETPVFKALIAAQNARIRNLWLPG